MYGIAEPILIVEDDQDVQETILSVFESDPDKQVLFAKDGLEALQVFEENDVFLIITDVRMPGMNGIDFCREVAKKNRPVSILVMSGMSKIPDWQELLKAGVSEFLEKPFDLDYLRERADDLISRQILKELEQRAMEALFAENVNSEFNYREFTNDQKIKQLFKLLDLDK